MKRQALAVGDKVGYSRVFLKSICAFTGDLPRAKGEIVEIKTYSKDLAIATIKWDLPDVPDKVNVKNLAKIGTVAYVD